MLNKVEGELQTLQDIANMIIEASADMIIVFDKETRFLLFNRKSEEIFNLKREEVLGKKCVEVFPQVINTRSYDDLIYALKGNYIHNKAHKSITGRYYETYFIPLLQNGEVYATIVTAHDVNDIIGITDDLKEANAALLASNEELRQSEERYHRMTNEVEDYAILLLDANGNIQNWNKGAERIKGYSADEIIGKHFRVFYPKNLREEKLPEKLIAEAASKGKATHEGWRVRKDGSVFWGYVVITALHDDRDNIIGYTKVTRDLTERKISEDKLRAAAEQLKQRNEDLEQSNSELKSFGYVASHDLQEPLRKIQTFGNLILDTELNNISKEGRDYFARMIKAANRMQLLIDSLLEFSRTTTLLKNFERADLNILLDDVKKELKESIEEKRATIRSSGLPVLTVIPFQIRQVLSNLITNAIKYSREDADPEIVITGSIVKAGQMHELKARPNTDYFKLTVQDNGIGFDQVYSERIFELFQRLHGKNEYSGSGIGLAIVKKIAENHDGFINAESRPGDGAIFSLFIPVS